MLSEFRSTNITWDKATSRIYSPVTANESDENGRKLVVQIVNGGQVEDLTGSALHLYWETIDKLHDGLDVFKAVDSKKGEFELSYTTGMLSNKGVLNANLVLVYTTGRVVSERFKITVKEGIDDDAIQSENSFSSLTQALIEVGPRVNSLAAQVQQKVDKGNVSVNDINKNLGKFDQTYMTEEFLQQMAGTAPINAIPADGSITTDKIADGIDILNKMAGLVKSGNLFDKDAVTSGYLDPGQMKIVKSGTYDTSDFMAVAVGQTYTFNIGRSIGHYDETKTLIEASSITGNLTHTFTAAHPFVRVSVHVHNLDGAKMEIGSEATRYEPYGNIIPGELLQYKGITGDRIGDGEINEDKLSSEHMSRLNSYDTLLVNGIKCFERNNETDITQDDFYLAKGYASIQDLEIIGVDPSTPIRLWLLSRDYIKDNHIFNKRFIFGKKVGGVWRTLIDSGQSFMTEEKAGGVTFVTYSEGGVTVRMRVNYNLIALGGRFIEGPLIDTEPAYIVRPECVSITEGSGGGGTAYDQSLNTTDSVSFENVTTNTLTADALNTSGELPVGTLANPPSGLFSGDAWVDTTDSATHPILRVKL